MTDFAFLDLTTPHGPVLVRLDTIVGVGVQPDVHGPPGTIVSCIVGNDLFRIRVTESFEDVKRILLLEMCPEDAP